MGLGSCQPLQDMEKGLIDPCISDPNLKKKKKKKKKNHNARFRHREQELNSPLKIDGMD